MKFGFNDFYHHSGYSRLFLRERRITTDIDGNEYSDLKRISELQKLVTKNPDRADLKMELIQLQKKVKPNIVNRRKKRK